MFLKQLIPRCYVVQTFHMEGGERGYGERGGEREQREGIERRERG